MNDLKRDDLDWRRGRHAAFVWHADDAVETVAREAYALFMTENGLGMRVFPSLRRMEVDVVAMVAGLLGGDASVMGHMTSGGTESIFLAAHAAREWARRHRPDVTAPEIVAAFSAHPAIDKAAHYLGMRVVRVPTGNDFRADVAAMAEAVTPKTIMCYASAPTYSLGVVDPVAELGALAEARGLWLHVDACVGGVLGPFVRSSATRCRRSASTCPAWPRSRPISTSRAMPPRAPRSSSTAMRRARPAALRVQRLAHRVLRRAHLRGDAAGRRHRRRVGGHALPRCRGYRRIAATVMQARARLVAGLAHIDGLHLWGEPDLWAVAYGAEDCDIHAVADAMTARRWSVGRVRKPPGIHLMLTPVHAPIVDDYLADLAASVATVRASAGTPSRTPVVY